MGVGGRSLKTCGKQYLRYSYLGSILTGKAGRKYIIGEKKIAKAR